MSRASASVTGMAGMPEPGTSEGALRMSAKPMKWESCLAWKNQSRRPEAASLAYPAP